MSRSTKVALLALALGAAWAPFAHAERKTVCTITVNSPDEGDVFRRSLPQAEFDFVELVERGRPDWLQAACRKGVQCDVLLISGHFDGGTEFYSDRPDVRESLPVDAMERATCSDSCPGVFSQLKEVYLFGCNTLNADAMRSASAEIARSLVRSGHSPADAERLSRELNDRYGESNRDRMRNVFKDVPVIYGFSSKAPLGAVAAPVLDRYFQAGNGAEIGSGRASARLLGLFAPVSMTQAAGLRESDPHADFRRDACHFSDDRLSQAQKLDFVHQLLGREMAEVRMFLDRIEKYAAALPESDRQAPDVVQVLGEIARDSEARTRYLAFARDADQSAVRARMLAVAQRLGWLSPADQRAETMRMLGERLAGNSVGADDVNLACTLNANGELDQDASRLQVPEAQAIQAAHSAVLACLGNIPARARVLRSLTSNRDEDVQLAQVYLHHRPLADAAELRGVAAAVARMDGTDAQVRALDTLARHPFSDPGSLKALVGVFSSSKSVQVQRAVAGILIRADYPVDARAELARALQQHRIKAAGGPDVIDALIRRLQAA